MAEPIKLIGLDFGTTTSSAVIAAAQLRHTATGRVELDFQEEIFCSELVFTPLLADDRIDEVQVELLLDSWLRGGAVHRGELFGGGALLTGLTAQKENAATLVQFIRRRLGSALVATADDPCLESWLAFMGSCAGLSRQFPESTVLNLDIGGGTTNIALGQNGQVLRTGCLFLGARHVQVIPGTYTIVRLSCYARELFDALHIAKGPGDDLSRTEVDLLLSFYLALLEAEATGNTEPFHAPVARKMEQVRFQMPQVSHTVVRTLSGGVGELVYRHLQGDSWPPTTSFGDLGIDLAQRILQAPLWEKSLRQYRPRSAGRATVYGLLRHTTEVSGNTLFLGAPGLLPLSDVPILGSLQADATEAHLRDVLTLVRRSPRGGCVQVHLGSLETMVVRGLGQRMAQILQQEAFPATHLLVLLVHENVGKVLGHYLTRWGTLPMQVLVIDEVSQRDAQFVQIGAPRHQVVPVSFYGLLPDGDLS